MFVISRGNELERRQFPRLLLRSSYVLCLTGIFCGADRDRSGCWEPLLAFLFEPSLPLFHKVLHLLGDRSLDLIRDLLCESSDSLLGMPRDESEQIDFRGHFCFNIIWNLKAYILMCLFRKILNNMDAPFLVFGDKRLDVLFGVVFS